MAKLDYPLYGDEATGTLARAIAYRRTLNYPTCAQLPLSKTPANKAQRAQRQKYRAGADAWNALTDAQKDAYKTNKPANLNGYAFFLKLFLSVDLFYLGYCVFYDAVYNVADSPDQPAAADYDLLFPDKIDDYPLMLNGAQSPQAWLYNRAADALTEIETYIINHKSNIERS
jgi:hypothetical protein